jgi:hypothetical protein
MDDTIKTEDTFKSFVHARLLRARQDVDYRDIEAYVASLDFRALEKMFDVNLLKQLDRFLARARGAALPPRQEKPATPPAWQLPELTAPSGTDAVPDRPVDTDPAPVRTLYEDRLVSMAPEPRRAADNAGHGLSAAPLARPVAQAPAVPATQSALAPPDLPNLVFRLPNGRAGSAYAQRLEAVDSIEALVFDVLDIPEGLPMSADLQSGALTGTPAAAGEYTIGVTYHYARESPSRQRRAHVQLCVVPDPRTMWMNLASDRADPYWKEDAQCSGVRGPELSIVAASKRGRSHAHVGGFRDDDYRIEHLCDSGWYVAVVADGAGSARYSRRGAAIICEEAKNRILGALSESTVEQIDAAARAHARASSDGLGEEAVAASREELHTKLSRIVGNAAYWAVRAIHDEIATRADLRGAFKDYSSTALIAMCKRYPFGTLCAAYWVGDGAVGIYSKGGGVVLLGDVDSGEFSGQTRFLDNTVVDHEVLRTRTRFAIVQDMTALVLMTDGVSDAKFETEARLARAYDWDAFWKDLDQAVDFTGPGSGQEKRLLDWLDFWSQGNHDDRTIAIIY